MRYLIMLMMLVSPALAGQDARHTDIAIAYPSTTMLFAAVDHTKLTQDQELEELMQGLNSEAGLPSINDVLTEKLQLELSEDEIRALTSGLQRSSAALLDVTIRGPSLQLVFEHPDLSAVTRALAKAHKDGKHTVPEVKDHYGSNVYTLYFPPDAADVQPGMDFRINPLRGWLENQDFWVAIHQNRYLIVSNTATAVTDALDFLAFPDDPADTLIASSRYREATGEYKDPHAIFYLSIESVITAVERLAGDKGSSPIMGAMPFWFNMDPEEWGFWGRLLQYEQFKSCAAAMWMDSEARTLRTDFGISFHNAPGWFEALRIEPKARPFADMIPADTTISITDCVEDPLALYERFKDFVLTRARTAGRTEIVEGWEGWEKELLEDGTDLKELLSHLSGEQAFLTLPIRERRTRWSSPVVSAGMLSVRDVEKAEHYLFETFLPSKLGRFLQPSEGNLSALEVYHGVEIHVPHEGEDVGFALAPRPDGSGVFLIGELEAIKRILDARANDGSVTSSDAWLAADGLLPPTSSLGIYMNAGAVLQTMSGAFLIARSWFDDEDSAEDGFHRDDTEKDADPIDYLSDFFSTTVIAGGMQTHQTGVRMRAVAAGWPTDEQMRGMVRHFRDVRRNTEVRDDLIKIREAAFAHFAIAGTPPADLAGLIDSGYIRDSETVEDPFGEDQPRHYLLAAVPADLDSRQAVLLAYQPHPGLRGSHLAVLWNAHIVELKPDELADAVKLAAEGKPLAQDRYREPAKALFTLNLDPAVHEEEWVLNVVRVVVIDDEGNEEAVEVQEENVIRETERILDAQRADENEDEMEIGEDPPPKD